MKAVLIKSDLTIEAIDLTEPLNKSLQAAVGGFFEIVRPQGLRYPYLMIVNENYIKLGLPRNEIGCYLYRTLIHGHPILGDIIIMKEGIVNADRERDLIGLDPLDVPLVINAMNQVKEITCSEVYRRAQ